METLIISNRNSTPFQRSWKTSAHKNPTIRLSYRSLRPRKASSRLDWLRRRPIVKSPTVKEGYGSSSCAKLSQGRRPEAFQLADRAAQQEMARTGHADHYQQTIVEQAIEILDQKIGALRELPTLSERVLEMDVAAAEAEAGRDM